MRTIPIVTTLLAVSLLAGCVNQPDTDDGLTGADALVDALGRTISTTSIERAGIEAEIHAAAGAVSEITATGGALHVILPDNAWLVEGRTLSFPDGAPVEVADGDTMTFLVSPFATNITLTLHADGIDPLDVVIETPWSPKASLVNGERTIGLMEHQEAEFPHRTPGMPNYERFQDYAVDFFTALDYPTVVKDPYGTNDVPTFPDEVPRGIKADSVANVWAYRPGTGTPDKIVGFGGHYDMVENTKHAAFDDTSGTIATMVLAEVFAQFDTDVGLLFGLWGGEEDGILGSQFFVRTNPDMVAQMVTYINLDVVSMAWPGPVIDPDPIVLTAGPDGAVADDLLAQGGAVFGRYIPEMPADKLSLEPWGGGQACGTSGQCEGAGVNAQSDHTPFITAGVPSYFIFDGNISNVLSFIHGPQDTLHNMTYFMATQEPIDVKGDEVEMTVEEAVRGRELLAQSFESMMSWAFYTTLEIDHGMYTPPVKGDM